MSDIPWRVSGRLAAGKTSLALPLAAELGYSLVAKDLIKETLHDAMHVPGEGGIDRAWSQRLGWTSMELLWALAARAGDVAAVAAEVRLLHGRRGPWR